MQPIHFDFIAFKHRGDLISKVSRKLWTHEFLIQCASINGHVIKYLPHQYLTSEIITTAVIQFPKIIRSVPIQFLNDDLISKAISLKPSLAQKLWVPDMILIKSILLNINVLQQIINSPYSYRKSEILYEIIKYLPYLISYIPNELKTIIKMIIILITIMIINHKQNLIL